MKIYKKLMTRYNSLFWIINTTSWLIMMVIVYLLFKERSDDFIDFFSNILYLFLSAFLITILHRYWYRFLFGRKLSVIVLSLSVIITSVLSVPLIIGLDYLFTLPFNPALQTMMHTSLREIAQGNFISVILLAFWGAMYFLVKYYIEWQTQTHETEQAALLAEQAQLQMLRDQLNPHFLFNSLNSVRAMISENKEVAEEMITDLAEFLRYSLMTGDKAFKSLGEEIEATSRYLSVEKRRFENNLEVILTIPDNTLEFPVPVFLLQPFVENAVKYGFQTCVLPLVITITSELRNDRLYMSVSNTGSWVDEISMTSNKETGHGAGRGISIIRQRLDLIYRDNYQLRIDKDPGIVRINIDIPKK